MSRLGLLAGAAALVLTPLTSLTASAAPIGQAGPSAHVPSATAPAHGTAAAPGTVRPAAAYNNACGSGYKVIDSLPISTLGTVFLTYNSSTGYNCIVTIRTNPGSAMPMEAGINLSGDGTTIRKDSGDYGTYAGPVYIKATGHCIDWWGWIGSYYNAKYNSHCG